MDIAEAGISRLFLFFGLVSKYEFHSVIIVDTRKSN